MNEHPVYYNEIDPFAVAWLHKLIKAGHIPNGIVDDRSIVDVDASDLQGFTQHHFFAGIGGWSHALRLAGWPDDKPAWTGSCPCQPFSVAGQQKGKDDDRHLAPHWLELITQCRPPVIFGEQVAASIGKGWLDDLQDHLEAEDYACGAIVLPACSVGAPHLRQRLWFVAENLVNPEREQREWGRAGETLSKPREKQRVERRGDADGVADTNGLRCEGQCGSWEKRITEHGGLSEGQPTTRPINSFWNGADWLYCKDKKWRPVEPGTFPLANGVPARVGRLRGYGNAIVPQVAAEVIKAMLNIGGK